MTLMMILAGGSLLVLVIAAMAVRLGRRRSGFSTDQLSGDWLAQARAREDQQW
jgi:hypothetical protein